MLEKFSSRSSATWCYTHHQPPNSHTAIGRHQPSVPCPRVGSRQIPLSQLARASTQRACISGLSGHIRAR